MSQEFQWPGGLRPEAEFKGVTVHVRADPESPGRNVIFLAVLLKRLRVCTLRLEERENSWGGKDLRLDFATSLEMRTTSTELRIVDYPIEGDWRGSGEGIDNMLALAFRGMKTVAAAEWLMDAFRLNGYDDARWEAVSDGTIDVFVASLFTSFKFNILPGDLP